MKSESEMSAEKPEKRPMWKGIVEGTVLGAAAMPVLTPFFYWTTRRVAKKPFVPAECMNSVGAYVLAVAPITAISYTCNQVLTDKMRQWKGEDLTNAEKVAIAATSGTIAGIANTPFDVIAQSKQMGEKTAMSQTVMRVCRANGPLAMMQGAGVSVPREAGWALAWISGVSMMRDVLLNQGCEKNTANGLAAVIMGTAFGFVSTPLNVLRFEKQKDLTVPKPKESYASIAKRYGAKGLFRGMVPRTATLVVASGIFAKGAELMQEYSPLSNKK